MDIDPRMRPDDDCSCNSAMTGCGDAANGVPTPGVSEWSNIKSVGGHCIYTLYTATRYGRKYFIKSLGENYRHLPEWRRLLFKEFELGIQLDHPGIVRTVSWETVSGAGEGVVLEYVDGAQLGEWLKSDTGKDRKERLKIAREIAEALDYIHSSGISHRDLKPDNILVTRNGNRVKIIDFGLGDSDGFIVYKQSAGTRAFGAPEQMPGRTREASMSADIYSFGKILSIMFPGRRYRSLIRKCLREDDSARPSASEVLESLNRNRKTRFLVTGLSLFAVSVFVGIHYISEQSRLKALEEMGRAAPLTDTVYINKKDTVTIEVPAKPSDSAIKAVWDKSLQYIEPQIKFQATFNFPDPDEAANGFEDIIHQWQDHLYYNLLEIGCSEVTARAKCKELEKYMRSRYRELKGAASAATSDSTAL